MGGQARAGPISIHAPSRERQVRLALDTDDCSDFNPRSLAGATSYLPSQLLLEFDFNPRSLAGATVALLFRQLSNLLFQSTLPRGSDKELENDVQAAKPFQSTLPRGSDKLNSSF